MLFHLRYVFEKELEVRLKSPKSSVIPIQFPTFNIAYLAADY